MTAYLLIALLIAYIVRLELAARANVKAWTVEREQFLADHRQLLSMNLIERGLPPIDTNLKPEPTPRVPDDVDLNSLESINAAISEVSEERIDVSMPEWERRVTLVDRKRQLESEGVAS